MSVEREEIAAERKGSLGRAALWGALFFIAILSLIVGIGVLLVLNDQGTVGAWLRALRDFMVLALLLELTLCALVAIWFFWRLSRFLEEISTELKNLSGDTLETLQLIQTTVQSLHQQLLRPWLYFGKWLIELQALLRAWLGLKEMVQERDAPAGPQAEVDSN